MLARCALAAAVDRLTRKRRAEREGIIMRRVLVALGLLATAAGCGNPTLPVTGKVVYEDGSDVSPLAGGLVEFEPLDRGATTRARSEIQADGTFRLSTSKGADGLPAGRYRVLIFPPPPPADEEGPRKRVIPPRYRDPQMSPLNARVDDDHTDFTFTVEKPTVQKP
jgi:hypothetical protein